MWVKIATFILRNRLILITLLGLATAFMAYKAREVKLSYQFLNILPNDDEDFKQYSAFKEKFGEDGSTLFIGLQNDNFFKLENFNSWFQLAEDVKSLDGVDDVLSMSHIYNLKKNSEAKRFDLVPLFETKPTTQEELDKKIKKIFNLPFYDGLIFNKETKATLMAIKISGEKVNSEARNELVLAIVEKAEFFGEQGHIKLHYSGLPLIRTNNTTKIAKELKQFIYYAIGVTAVILLLFFRSFYAVIFPLIVVIAGVVWSIGSLVLFGYDMTLLTGLIPPLIVVIGIPNCIFLLNKYHDEYRKHGDKFKSLSRMVQKIGVVTFLTNFTTAIGFGVFSFTDSPLLKEFGNIAALNIMMTYIISIIFIPVVFSYLPPPSVRATKHLENKITINILNAFAYWINNRRPTIYIVTSLLIVLSVVGFVKIKTGGYFTEDVPKSDPIYQDLVFFENNFDGVMPFEILIDAKKKGKITRLTSLQKMEELNIVLREYPELSLSLSIVDFAKFTRQAFYNGKLSKYALPTKREQSFILPYVSNSEIKNDLGFTVVDENKQKGRISVRIADVGALRIDEIKQDLTQKIKKIFDPEKYNVLLTGTSLIFSRSNSYLIKNLKQSLLLAILFISILMAMLFSSYKMLIIAMIPNFIPLLITAGVMGFFNIPLKPSTVLIFSVAFGISVDNTIHYLAKYRQELKSNELNISVAVNTALKDAGVSMLYTSIILLCGFSIFMGSNFGGTVALGLLVSLTLMFAMFANLVLLPSMLLTLER
ncbi:MAG: MMPL family transporter, partial [Bacteroidia bacterium]|nr:MMPL family transporter [Bacteroidia bacterium]